MKINDLSIGILSYRAHETLKASLRSHVQSGLTSLSEHFFIYFNDLDNDDITIANEFNLPYHGAKNSGIYGGFRAIAEKCETDYVLILENDIITLQHENIYDCIQSCLQDMKAHAINVFSLRSRITPGQGLSSKKYKLAFGLQNPIQETAAPYKATFFDKVSMLLKHGYRSKFKGRAIMFEQHPEKVHPDAISKLHSENYVTDSRFCNWSNQSVLVKKSFFLDIIYAIVWKHIRIQGQSTVFKILKKL